MRGASATGMTVIGSAEIAVSAMRSDTATSVSAIWARSGIGSPFRLAPAGQSFYFRSVSHEFCAYRRSGATRIGAASHWRSVDRLLVYPSQQPGFRINDASFSEPKSRRTYATGDQPLEMTLTHTE
jgi:hypothetical protein